MMNVKITLVVVGLCLCLLQPSSGSRSDGLESWPMPSNDEGRRFVNELDGYTFEGGEDFGRCGVSPWVPPPPPQQPSTTNALGGGGAKEGFKISRGQPVDDPQALPWMAQLLWQGEPLCTATIVHPSYVITASHCLYQSYLPFGEIGEWKEKHTSNYTLVAGMVQLATAGQKGGVRRVSRRIIPHPDYRLAIFFLHDDVALIELAVPLPLSPTVRPVCLSPENITFGMELAKGVVIAGFGQLNRTTGMEPLHSARVDIAPTTDCHFMFPFNSTKHICTRGNASACGGDSGSPMLIRKMEKGDEAVRWEQIGVAMSGHVRNETCVSPDAYTRVAPYCAWITAETSGSVKCQ